MSIDIFLQRLADVSHQPMLDIGAERAARHSNSDKTVRQPAGGAGWQMPTLVAADLMMRLPGLDRLPLIDVLDLREDLADYLPAFRSEMMRLGEDIMSTGEMSRQGLGKVVR